MNFYLKAILRISKILIIRGDFKRALKILNNHSILFHIFYKNNSIDRTSYNLYFAICSFHAGKIKKSFLNLKKIISFTNERELGLYYIINCLYEMNKYKKNDIERYVKIMEERFSFGKYYLILVIKLGFASIVLNRKLNLDDFDTNEEKALFLIICGDLRMAYEYIVKTSNNSYINRYILLLALDKNRQYKRLVAYFNIHPEIKNYQTLYLLIKSYTISKNNKLSLKHIEQYRKRLNYRTEYNVTYNKAKVLYDMGKHFKSLRNLKNILKGGDFVADSKNHIKMLIAMNFHKLSLLNQAIFWYKKIDNKSIFKNKADRILKKLYFDLEYYDQIEKTPEIEKKIKYNQSIKKYLNIFIVSIFSVIVLSFIFYLIITNK